MQKYNFSPDVFNFTQDEVKIQEETSTLGLCVTFQHTYTIQNVHATKSITKHKRQGVNGGGLFT